MQRATDAYLRSLSSYGCTNFQSIAYRGENLWYLCSESDNLVFQNLPFMLTPARQYCLGREIPVSHTDCHMISVIFFARYWLTERVIHHFEVNILKSVRWKFLCFPGCFKISSKIFSNNSWLFTFDISLFLSTFFRVTVSISSFLPSLWALNFNP